MTFDATINPVAYEDGEAVFIDTEYETWNIFTISLLLVYRSTNLIIFKIFSSLIFATDFIAFFISIRDMGFEKTFISHWLGKHSFDIYVLQGFWLLAFREIQNKLLYLILVLLLTLLSAYIIMPVRSYCEKQWRK